MTTPGSFPAWDGSPLPDSELSLAVFSVPVTGGTTTDRALLLAAACGGGQSVVLWPDQVREFLCIHSDRTIVCHDAGAFHWLLHSHLGVKRNPEAVETLWGFSRNSRLADIMLLDQLVQLADQAFPFPAARPLHELAAEVLDRSLEDVASVELQLQSALAEKGPLSANLTNEFLEIASVAKLIFSKLKHRAVELAHEHGIDLQTMAKFGPLGLGIEVKTAIAVAAIRRHSLHIDPDAVESVIQTCDALFDAGARLLYRDADAGQCFRTRNVRREFKLNNLGFLQPRRESLRKWLTSVQRRAIGADGLCLPGVFYAAADFVARPEDYGVRTGYDHLLHAWSDCEGAARVRDLARTAPEHGIRPEYEIIPRLATSQPNLATVGKIAPGGLFEAGDGKQLLIVGFPELELRSLASVLERRVGATGLAAVFRDGRSPTQEIANCLGGQRGKKSDAVEDDEQAQWTAIATTAIEAIALRLGNPIMKEMIRCRTGHVVGLSDVAAFERTVLQLFPELSALHVDRTYSVLADRLRVSLSECETALRGRNGELPPPAELKRLFFGLEHRLDPRLHPDLFRKMRHVNRNPELSGLLLDGAPSAGMYDHLLSECHVAHTGRVRYRARLSDFNAEYLDIADAVLKSVMYALVEAGLEMVGCNGQVIAVEVPVENDLDVKIARIQDLVVRTAAMILAPVPAACICEPRRRW